MRQKDDEPPVKDENNAVDNNNNQHPRKIRRKKAPAVVNNAVLVLPKVSPRPDKNAPLKKHPVPAAKPNKNTPARKVEDYVPEMINNFYRAKTSAKPATDAVKDLKTLVEEHNTNHPGEPFYILRMDHCQKAMMVVLEHIPLPKKNLFMNIISRYLLYMNQLVAHMKESHPICGAYINSHHLQQHRDDCVHFPLWLRQGKNYYGIPSNNNKKWCLYEMKFEERKTAGPLLVLLSFLTAGLLDDTYHYKFNTMEVEWDNMLFASIIVTTNELL
jgi:hypothetical protein